MGKRARECERERERKGEREREFRIACFLCVYAIFADLVLQ